MVLALMECIFSWGEGRQKIDKYIQMLISDSYKGEIGENESGRLLQRVIRGGGTGGLF